MARTARLLHARLMAAHEAGAHEAGDPMAGPRAAGRHAADDGPAGPCWTAGPQAAFDAHIFACVLALAAEEAEAEGGAIAARVGLDAEELEALFARYFSPRAFAGLPAPVGRDAPDEERDMVRDLLIAHRRDGDPVHGWMAAVVARRSLLTDHLWQDLGLTSRAELSRLLGDHFPALAAGNTANMKWKKYFYRRLCEAEGFALCTAPSCKQCSDFEACFGDESGESRLARTRRDAPRPVPRTGAEAGEYWVAYP